MREWIETVTRAVQARPALHPSGAQRLFNGFTEGWQQVVVEQYGDCLVVINHIRDDDHPNWLTDLTTRLLQTIPGIQSVLVKQRHSRNMEEKKGWLAAGERLPDAVVENGVHYALDLRLNQDTSFYLDSRQLRIWLKEHLQGCSLLNTFAYTGSLGVAALAGGARLVVQTDVRRHFLALADRSASLNSSAHGEQRLLPGDFFRVTADLRRQGARFDCVILDPPFFSTSAAGTVDLQRNMTALINKVRPLVSDGGWLVAVNNALYLSGRAYLDTLDRLTQDGYLTIETLLPVDADCIGYPQTIQSSLPADPAPFNHATKMAILGVTRK